MRKKHPAFFQRGATQNFMLLRTWGTPEQQRHLAVGDGLLGQVVVDDESVHAVVTEELAHGAAGVGSQVLQGSSVGSGGRHDDAGKSKSCFQMAICSLLPSSLNHPYLPA